MVAVFLLSSVLPVPADSPDLPDGETFDWGPESAPIQVLVVLDRSDYNDFVLDRILKEAGEGVRFVVQPFSTYHNTSPLSWDLRILFVPVYGDDPAVPALRYMARLERTDNVLMVVTYGDGGFSSVPEGVDVVSSSTVDITTAESLADSAVQQVRAKLYPSPQ